MLLYMSFCGGNRLPTSGLTRKTSKSKPGTFFGSNRYVPNFMFSTFYHEKHKRCNKVLRNQPINHCERPISCPAIVSDYSVTYRASVKAQDAFESWNACKFFWVRAASANVIIWSVAYVPHLLSHRYAFRYKNTEKAVGGALKILTFFYAIFLGLSSLKSQYSNQKS